MVSYGMFAVFLSEFLTTAFLVICSCLAITAQEVSAVSLSVTALSAGLSQLVLMKCFGHISGAHGNPAISLAIWYLGCLNSRRLLIFLFAQVTGAIVGHYTINKILDEVPGDNVCSFGPKVDFEDLQLFGVEFLLTFLLVMAWCALWDYENIPLELYLAMANAIVCLLGEILTGAAANPARALAPIFFSGKIKKRHIYLAGELSAAIAAPFALKTLRKWIKA